MPLLWQDEVIGWVNISNPHGKLMVESGFSKEKPSETCFQMEFDAELERFRRFLQGRAS